MINKYYTATDAGSHRQYQHHLYKACSDHPLPNLTKESQETDPPSDLSSVTKPEGKAYATCLLVTFITH